MHKKRVNLRSYNIVYNVYYSVSGVYKNIFMYVKYVGRLKVQVYNLDNNEQNNKYYENMILNGLEAAIVCLSLSQTRNIAI